MKTVADIVSKNGGWFVRLTLSPYPLMSVSVKVTEISSEYMIVAYSTIPHNNPSANGNTAQAWQDAEPEYDNPEGGWKAKIAGSTIQGDLPLQFLYQKKDYIVCYAVGPNVRNIVATTYIPDGDIDKQILFSPTLGVQPGQDTVLVTYLLPEGCKPGSFGHWIGLFNQDDDPFNDSPLVRAAVGADTRAGTVPVVYSFGLGRSYTAVYFAGSAQSCAACTYTFSIGN
jgi:hypothetical protein